MPSLSPQFKSSAASIYFNNMIMKDDSLFTNITQGFNTPEAYEAYRKSPAGKKDQAAMRYMIGLQLREEADLIAINQKMLNDLSSESPEPEDNKKTGFEKQKSNISSQNKEDILLNDGARKLVENQKNLASLTEKAKKLLKNVEVLDKEIQQTINSLDSNTKQQRNTVSTELQQIQLSKITTESYEQCKKLLDNSLQNQDAKLLKAEEREAGAYHCEIMALEIQQSINTLQIGIALLPEENPTRIQMQKQIETAKMQQNALQKTAATLKTLAAADRKSANNEKQKIQSDDIVRLDMKAAQSGAGLKTPEEKAQFKAQETRRTDLLGAIRARCKENNEQHDNKALLTPEKDTQAQYNSRSVGS